MTQFDADTGIDMGLGKRLFFALRFADINILLNQDITSQSQLLWRRNIVERMKGVAPFLRYDRDPYIVVDGCGRSLLVPGRLYRQQPFPVQQPLGNGINYIRNSVKIVTDAPMMARCTSMWWMRMIRSLPPTAESSPASLPADE